MWEYLRKEIKYKTFVELNDELNIFGRDNWNIIYFQSEQPIKFGEPMTAEILFKRPKKNQNDG